MHALRIALLGCFTLLLLAAGAWGVQQHYAAGQALLWRVERAGVPASYVFGTIHSEDRRVLRLAEPVLEAWRAADTLVLEAMLDPADGAALSRAMFHPPGEAAADVLPPALRAAAMRLLEDYGIPGAFASAMKPWAMVLTLSMPRAETGIFLDLDLQRRARERGMPVHGLETAAEQIGYFDAMPLDDQIMLLEETVARHDDTARMHNALIEAWLARDLAGLQALNEAYLDGGDPALAQRFRRRFITARNQLMVERMQAYLTEGGAFVAVGALHLPGEDGILSLLKRRGFAVEAVY